MQPLNSSSYWLLSTQHEIHNITYLFIINQSRNI